MLFPDVSLMVVESGRNTVIASVRKYSDILSQVSEGDSFRCEMNEGFIPSALIGTRFVLNLTLSHSSSERN